MPDPVRAESGASWLSFSHLGIHYRHQFNTYLGFKLISSLGSETDTGLRRAQRLASIFGVSLSPIWILHQNWYCNTYNVLKNAFHHVLTIKLRQLAAKVVRRFRRRSVARFELTSGCAVGHEDKEL